MTYTPEKLQEMETLSRMYYVDCYELQYSLIKLSEGMNDDAKKHAVYGVARRLINLRECMKFFFDKLPPNLTAEADDELLAQANSMLHAFLIHSSGIHDNIAWLLAFHKNVHQDHDLDKKRMKVVLYGDWFRQFLTPKLLKRVDETKDWFEHILNHRHPTAHRIPPYLIPYIVYQDTSERDYTPRYIHDLSESVPVLLHAQSLRDIGCVILTVKALIDDIKPSISESM